MTNETFSEPHKIFSELLDPKLFDDKTAEVCKNIGDYLAENFEEKVPPQIILSALSRLISIHLASYSVVFNVTNAVERTLTFIKESTENIIPLIEDEVKNKKKKRKKKDGMD